MLLKFLHVDLFQPNKYLIFKFFTILIVIKSIKSLNSITPLYSRSTSAIIFLISSFFGSNPKALMATFNSLASIYPVPSVSKRSKASLISYFYSSVKSERAFLLLLTGGFVYLKAIFKYIFFKFLKKNFEI